MSDKIIYEYFGYKKNKTSNSDFYKRMKKQYKQDIDHKEISSDDELVKLYEKFYPEIFLGKKNARGGSLKKYYAITGEAFKKMGMRANTKRGEEICDYFIKVESLASLMTKCVIKKLELENKEKEEQLNRLHDIHKELLSYKKRVSKDEIIYIVSTAQYARQGIFKVGRTKNAMKVRNSTHNSTHITGDKVKTLKEFKVNDAVLVEKIIHNKLSGLAVKGEKEIFLCPYDLLENLVDIVINNDDEENEVINKIIDIVFKLKQIKFNTEDWMSGISENTFKETLEITQNDQKLIEFNATNWSDENRKVFIENCVQEYIQMQNKVNQSYVIIWKAFQLFLIEKLSIPKYKFKVSEWKDAVKETVSKEKQLCIKWRN